MNICPNCKKEELDPFTTECFSCDTKLVILPRKKHSHRCKACGRATYCYKTNCTNGPKLEFCRYCR